MKVREPSAASREPIEQFPAERALALFRLTAYGSRLTSLQAISFGDSRDP